MAISYMDNHGNPRSSPSGDKLSAADIAELWTGKDCATAVAVALAESSGNCKASHTNSGGSIDRGLWQVNSKYHPECSESCAYECDCNAGCAKSISSDGKDWTPWATYNSGAHLKYLPDAKAACLIQYQELQSSADSEAENLSASQIAAVWSGSNCATAVAVALAESSGNCKASHTNSGGSIDRGLWQVNSKWHPECSDSCAYDCSCNAGCAKSISSGGKDWTPWATYNAGAHLKYMSQAQAACGGLEDVV